MKKVCLRCERSSLDGNLYCQEIYCPAEMAPYVLEPGEWLGDLEIVRTVVVLRAATLYEAQQGTRRVLLKVAHPGSNHTERIKREAMLIRELGAARNRVALLPTLLPAYANTSVASDPYGKAMLHGHLLYYCLFEHVAGDSLRDVLLKNPQLWIYHVGWLLSGIATTVALMQSKGLLHYGICPESVLIHYEGEEATPRPLLIDLGIACSHERVGVEWYPDFMLPAYSAPELIDNPQPKPSYRTDVYGLGIVLYELLIGEPPYPDTYSGDATILEAIRESRRQRMSRVEDVREVAELALSAVSQDLTARPADAATFAARLGTVFSETPTKQRVLWLSPQFALIVGCIVLLVAFVLTLGVMFAA